MDRITARKVNPITLIRVRSGLEREALARKLDIHVSALLMLEQGCYVNILPSVLTWLSEEGWNVSEVKVNYREFQRDKRHAVGLLYNLSEFELDVPNLKEHPFTSFRKKLGLSRSGFGKKFAVNAAALHNLEKGLSLQLPTQLRQALREAGLRKEVIEELDFRTSEVKTYYKVA